MGLFASKDECGVPVGWDRRKYALSKVHGVPRTEHWMGHYPEQHYSEQQACENVKSWRTYGVAKHAPPRYHAMMRGARLGRWLVGQPPPDARNHVFKHVYGLTDAEATEARGAYTHQMALDEMHHMHRNPGARPLYAVNRGVRFRPTSNAYKKPSQTFAPTPNTKAFINVNKTGGAGAMGVPVETNARSSSSLLYGKSPGPGHYVGHHVDDPGREIFRRVINEGSVIHHDKRGVRVPESDIVFADEHARWNSLTPGRKAEQMKVNSKFVHEPGFMVGTSLLPQHQGQAVFRTRNERGEYDVHHDGTRVKQGQNVKWNPGFAPFAAASRARMVGTSLIPEHQGQAVFRNRNERGEFNVHHDGTRVKRGGNVKWNPGFASLQSTTPPINVQAGTT